LDSTRADTWILLEQTLEFYEIGHLDFTRADT
jgi:hypothetical protein